jgi:hypothetical protein
MDFLLFLNFSLINYRVDYYYETWFTLASPFQIILRKHLHVILWVKKFRETYFFF